MRGRPRGPITDSNAGSISAKTTGATSILFVYLCLVGRLPRWPSSISSERLLK
jgi:hypothetical protein